MQHEDSPLDDIERLIFSDGAAGRCCWIYVATSSECKDNKREFRLISDCWQLSDPSFWLGDRRNAA